MGALSVAAVVYGVGLALTFDEFGMWLHLGGGYWQRASFDGVSVVATLLGLVAYAPAIQQFRPAHWWAAVVSVLPRRSLTSLVADNESDSPNKRIPMTKRSRFDLLVLLCVALVSYSCAESGLPLAPSTDSPPVVREIFSQIDDPPGAPNRRLTLVRYTIAPAAELVPHVHPGVQIASIVSGTLTYRVVSGTATIHRQVAASGASASVETVEGPADTELRPGDAIIEEASMGTSGRTGHPSRS